MKCPKCRFENPEGIRFCGQCGSPLERICPGCSQVNPPIFNFCGSCGSALAGASPSIPAVPSAPAAESPSSVKEPLLEQGRKYVTVVFSDLSGYTSMSESLDPEEVKEIMGRIYGEIAQVVVKYEGHIDKFIGDAAMVLFGFPKTHEDDPVRAIRAAHEIHEVVKGLNPSLGKRISKPLCMHTGINTGLVVTGEINLERGIHGVLGDTINVASRLCSFAQTDEIVVGHETYHQAEGHFDFDKLEPASVKGKEEALEVYRFMSPKDVPLKTHRLSGRRSDLIGRRVEMTHLKEAVGNLKQGRSSIFSIIGEAGTGKSRLIEELKSTLDLDEVQWREGHAYAFSQNIPYFPMIDLLNRAWQIREGDHPHEVRQKIESGAGALLGERNDLIPYIGSLYALPYKEIEPTVPETMKARLHEAIHLIFMNLCRRAPTIICIEDLHWADASTIELMQKILSDLRYPVLFLSIYRPPLSLFTSLQESALKAYQEIRIKDLSSSESQDMVESLLRTRDIPTELKKFVQGKAEGNPFYLEEVINSLIETDILTNEDGIWKLSRPLTEKDIPSTVQGVISARLDRLERDTKRVLQEASVIGRVFLYDILSRISDLKDFIDKSLMSLERLDLIKTRSFEPDLEYIFKHALTQEVVYQGLLLKERRSIHEKIGSVMEEIFHDRVPEFYETLAYHYSLSNNPKKACEFLKLAGEKAAKSYATAEAIRFYREALKVLEEQPESVETKKERLDIRLLLVMPMMFQGYPDDTLEVLQDAERLAQELGDEKNLATVYARMVHYHTLKGDLLRALECSEKSFEEAERIGSIELMAQIARDMSTMHSYLGNLSKVVDLSRRTLPLIEDHHREKDLSMGGVNVYAMISGNCSISLGLMGEFAEGRMCLEKGLKNTRETSDRFAVGWLEYAYSMLSISEGDGENVMSSAREAIQCFEDARADYTAGAAWAALGAGYAFRGEFETAREHAEKGLRMQEKFGLPGLTAMCCTYLGMVHLAAGDFEHARECTDMLLKLVKEHKLRLGEGIGLILFGGVRGKADPGYVEEAQNDILQGISILKEINARAFYVMGHLILGELFADAGRKQEALENLKKAESMYLEMKVLPESYWLKRIREALARLESKP